jgi:hypothetical protein
VTKIEIGITRDLSKRALRRGEQKAGYETENLGKGSAADEVRLRLSTTTTPARAASRSAASSPVEFHPASIRHKTCAQKEKPTRPKIGTAWVSVLLNL